jgi:8-oxo-dGTP diphosphatase
MVKVEFYSPNYDPESELIYSIIAARFKDEWIFVRHKKRTTWEIAGGHIELNETPMDAARRELEEETGAIEYDIECIATYSVTENYVIGFGRLYFAEVSKLGPVPGNSEIGEIILMKKLPENLTHPEIQPHLFRKTLDFLKRGEVN